MTEKTIKPRLFFVILSTLSSCDPGVPDAIDLDRIVSVVSFISPQDSVLTAHVFRVQRLGEDLETERSVVANAKVTISNSSGSCDLVFSEKNLRYEYEVRDTTIAPLVTYALRVELPDGQVLTANCRVPGQPNPVEIVGSRDNDDFRFTCLWSNTYSSPYSILSTTGRGSYLADTPSGPMMSPLRPLLDNGTFVLGAKLQSNESGVVRRAFLATAPELVVHLRNIDVNMFRYYESYSLLETWLSNTNNLIPNFSSPVPVYSNVTGGTGAFGAFYLSTQSFEIK
jgi:hypothetical protein